MFQIISRKQLLAANAQRRKELCWKTLKGDFSDGPHALLHELVREYEIKRMPRYQVIWVSNKRKS